VAAAQGWETKITAGAIPLQSPPLFHLAHPKNKLVQIAPPAAEPKPAPAKDVPAPVQKEPTVPAAKDYCINIIDAAADARVAWQKKLLADTGKEIDERIAQLEKKTAEYKAWLKRRDEFTQRATDTVLQIYERMRPDAAAVQLAQLDDETAAAVLTKLKPTLSSKILNDMDPTRAAHLTSTIVGSGKVYTAVAKSTKVEAEK
jgi:flagellar motility protein MotE (MotC chaperone)